MEDTCRQGRQLDPHRQITLDASPDLSMIGDRDAFKQILLIALDNALKHSDGEIIFKAAVTGSGVEVRIQDCGEGIPPEILERIFDRFYRGEDAAVKPGLGLGLSIANALVEGQGGTIEMESELGKGSLLILNFACDQRGA
jgi:signal transduction histidine kinase